MSGEGGSLQGRNMRDLSGVLAVFCVVDISASSVGVSSCQDSSSCILKACPLYFM